MYFKKSFASGILICLFLAGCVRLTNPLAQPWKASTPLAEAPDESVAASSPTERVVRQLGQPVETPTVDPPHLLPTLRANAEEYVVQAGDTLGIVSQRFGVSLELLIQANNLTNPDLLEVGRVLVIPAPAPGEPGSTFKIIPDSELVNSPSSVGFDMTGYVKVQNGYLARYQEEVDGEQLKGAAIVRRVAQEYSVAPRLLLAALEYQSKWVTQANPKTETLDYPMRKVETWRKGLYQQLAWAANTLNRGYYLWRVDGISSWVLQDGTAVLVDAGINAGTAGVQSLFAALYGRSAWDSAVSKNGLFNTYFRLFGYPFDYAVEPLLPVALTQPVMQLPFEPGQDWAFTGGPHGGWGGGSAWAALDFAPPGEALGCVQSDAWVVAVADGLIVRSDHGAVVQDLDGDGLEQTGWTVLYMHVESRDRVPEGSMLKAGDRIGHPSCEGGVSTGTHMHLARRYNGEWIPADQSVPFILDGWVSSGTGVEYDGYLKKDGQTVEAWEGYYPENTIHRP